ncbi:GGDEF domain-containing protein [Effusibacillus consociatus]|uniref:GGDEF domain-containing protein n=1 Tax=Effusibacillus consociatus TaxID=1117041 RepID=A0ABV9Q790_9BACL
MFYVDVDNFKYINDTYSRETGDRVLCQLSNLLEKTTSKYDYVARWGGDEFVVIVPYTDEEGARALQRRLGSALFISLEEWKTLVYLSVGYAVCPDESTDLGELLRMADKRMYKQKFSQHND